MSKKNHNQENFPVASFLIRKELRPQIFDFYNFARKCDDIADNPKLSAAKKLELLNSQKTENPYLQDLLKAFRQDAEGFEYKTFKDLLKYCKHSAAPVGRFLLSLHKQGSAAGLPSDSLCAALQIVNHLQDIKHDASVLKRIYLPADLMSRYEVSADDLSAPRMSRGLRNLIYEILSKVEELLKEASILPGMIRDFGLRCEVCVIISLTKSMIKKLKRQDVLAVRVKLSKFDFFKAFAVGLFKGI